MKVLIACESSGVVRDAFLRAGHEAISADLQPTETPGPHYHGDARDLLNNRRDHWDLLIAHPPCTYLALSGVHLIGTKDRYQHMLDAADLFRAFLHAPIERICVENPRIHGYALAAIGLRSQQIIQPWQYGEDASKRTHLWLKNLPRLRPTGYVVRRQYANQTPSGENKLGPQIPNRAQIRARTYPGIAAAMADQWGTL